jgi:DNA repair protein RadD
MSAPLQLRDYQLEAVSGIYEWFEDHTDNPLVVMPTGSGKSAVIAVFVRVS